MKDWQRPAIWILAAASVLPVWAALRVAERPPGDDALITLTYAKNLARGDGFLFNHPPPTLGTTSPLYAAVVAGLDVFAPWGDPPKLAIAVSAACWIAVLWLLWTLRRALGLSEWQAVTAGLMVVATGWVGHLDMEAYLFAVLLAAATGLYFGGRPVWSGSLCGLLFLTRGEGVLLLPILLATALARELARQQAGGARPRPTAALLCLGFGAVVVPWCGYALATFGVVLPNTLAAKIAQGETGLWRPFAEQLLTVWAPEWGGGLRIAGLPALNLWYGFAIIGLVVVGLGRRPLLVVVVWAAGFVAGYSALGVAGYPWYGLPVLLVLSLLAGVGLGTLAEAVVRRGAGRAPAVLTAVALVAVMVVRLAAPTVRAALDSRPTARHQAYLELAGWLAGNVPREASVAYHEIGYLGYYTDCRIIDLMGLVLPDVTPHVAAGDFAWGFWRYQPDYFIRLEGSGFQAAIVGDPRFVAGYRPAATLPGFDGRSLTVYRRVDVE